MSFSDEAASLLLHQTDVVQNNQEGAGGRFGGLDGGEGGSKKRSRPLQTIETHHSSTVTTFSQPLHSPSSSSLSSVIRTSNNPVNYSVAAPPIQSSPVSNRSVHQNLRLLQISMTEFKKNGPALRADIAERVALVKRGAAWARCLQKAKDDLTHDRSERDKLIFSLPEHTVVILPNGDFAGIIKLGDVEIVTSSFPTVLEAAVCADYGTSFLRAHEIEHSPVVEAVRAGVRELNQIAADMNDAFSFSALLAPNAPRLNFPLSAADCRICPPVDPWPPLVLLAWEIAETATSALLAPSLPRPLPTLPTRNEWNGITEGGVSLSPYLGLESIHTSIGMWLPLNATFDKLFYSEMAIARRSRMNINLTSLPLLSSSPLSSSPLSSSPLPTKVSHLSLPTYSLLHPVNQLPHINQSATILTTLLPQIRSLTQLLLPPPLLYLETPPSPFASLLSSSSTSSSTSTNAQAGKSSAIKIKSEVHFDKTAIQWLIENKKIEPVSEEEDEEEEENLDDEQDRFPNQPDGDANELIELERRRNDNSIFV